VATAALLLSLPWYALMVLIFGPAREIPLLVPIGLATALTAGVFFLLKQWALKSEWQDLHRWALCLGALLVCMLGGFLGAGTWPLLDTVAKAILKMLTSDYIFVMTDGFTPRPTVRHPDRWVWILRDWGSTDVIPKGSRIEFFSPATASGIQPGTASPAPPKRCR